MGHMEHVVMIRLGRMSQAHSLSTEKSLATKYMKIKGEYRRLMNRLVEENILQEHETNTDIFARLDNEMKETKHTSYITDEDTLIQKAVTNLMQQTKVPVSQKDYIYHMEHIVLIKLGRLAQKCTLTFTKYKRIKENQREKGSDEIETYNPNDDIFSMIDDMLIRREKILTGTLSKHDLEVMTDRSRPEDERKRRLEKEKNERRIKEEEEKDTKAKEEWEEQKRKLKEEENERKRKKEEEERKRKEKEEEEERKRKIEAEEI